MASGIQHTASSNRHVTSATWHPAFGIWHSVFCICHSAFGIFCVWRTTKAFGIQHSVSGIRNLVSGILHSASSIRHRKSAFSILPADASPCLTPLKIAQVAFGIRHSASGNKIIRHSAFGILHPEYGIRHLAFGILHPEFGIRHSARLLFSVFDAFEDGVFDAFQLFNSPADIASCNPVERISRRRRRRRRR